MYLFNKFRNFININPFTRRLFVRLVSPFTAPLLILKKYLSIKGYEGLLIDNEYTKEKANIKIDELIKLNVNNLLNGNYFFS